MTATPNEAATSAVPGVDEASLASALGTVDTQAAQRLTTVGLVYQARQTRLARNAASIAAQQGAGSAQATAAEAEVAAAKMTAARLAVVQQQVSTAEPTVVASGWALHGRVYTAQLAPVAGYCVFLVDAQNAYYSPAGFAYTDSTGYFQLTYPGTAAQADTSTGTPDSAVQPPTLYVEITNPHGLPVYLSTTALAPTLGTAAYQTFSLSASEQPIGDPPSEVRATALPPKVRQGTEPVHAGVTLTPPTMPTPAQPAEQAPPTAPAPAEPAAPENAAPTVPAPAESAAAGSAAPTRPAPVKPAAPEEGSATVPTEVMPAVPATAPLRVRVTSSVDKGRSFALYPGELTIGREKGSAIQLRGRGVSKNHALLRVHDEDVTIDDLRSTNGTKVNGVAIDRQTNLVPGDVIDVGGVQLVVELNQVTGPDES
jgi:FHA domain